MQEIIEKIYRGELYPAEQIDPMLQDFRVKWEESKDNTAAFSNQLSDELKPLFEARKFSFKTRTFVYNGGQSCSRA